MVAVVGAGIVVGAVALLAVLLGSRPGPTTSLPEPVQPVPASVPAWDPTTANPAASTQPGVAKTAVTVTATTTPPARPTTTTSATRGGKPGRPTPPGHGR